ncbi:hypothetical protein HK101_006248 [Irineochytrium annulatum]|nr:hypothetical protein HK101_006248 [Irineochytrium annulatum]
MKDADLGLGRAEPEEPVDATEVAEDVRAIGMLVGVAGRRAAVRDGEEASAPVECEMVEADAADGDDGIARWGDDRVGVVCRYERVGVDWGDARDGVIGGFAEKIARFRRVGEAAGAAAPDGEGALRLVKDDDRGEVVVGLSVPEMEPSVGEAAAAEVHGGDGLRCRVKEDDRGGVVGDVFSGLKAEISEVHIGGASGLRDCADNGGRDEASRVAKADFAGTGREKGDEVWGRGLADFADVHTRPFRADAVAALRGGLPRSRLDRVGCVGFVTCVVEVGAEGEPYRLVVGVGRDRGRPLMEARRAGGGDQSSASACADAAFGNAADIGRGRGTGASGTVSLSVKGRNDDEKDARRDGVVAGPSSSFSQSSTSSVPDRGVADVVAGITSLHENAASAYIPSAIAQLAADAFRVTCFCSGRHDLLDYAVGH